MGCLIPFFMLIVLILVLSTVGNQHSCIEGRGSWDGNNCTFPSQVNP